MRPLPSLSYQFSSAKRQAQKTTPVSPHISWVETCLVVEMDELVGLVEETVLDVVDVVVLTVEAVLEDVTVVVVTDVDVVELWPGGVSRQVNMLVTLVGYFRTFSH